MRRPSDFNKRAKRQLLRYQLYIYQPSKRCL